MAEKKKEKKEHRVQVIMHDHRYVAIELGGVISVARDGNFLGKARWKDDQMVDSGAPLPDDVCEALEKLIKVGMDTDWGE